MAATHELLRNILPPDLTSHLTSHLSSHLTSPHTSHPPCDPKGITLRSGLMCVMVLHQPRYSIFEMFDSVLLLGAGGKTVYLG